MGWNLDVDVESDEEVEEEHLGPRRQHEACDMQHKPIKATVNGGNTCFCSSHPLAALLPPAATLSRRSWLLMEHHLS